MRRVARTVGKVAVLCLPVALVASLSADVSLANAESDRNAWLNSLVGPVVAAPGAAAPGQAAPGTAVLPAGGDLQVLVITQGADADAAPGIQTGLSADAPVTPGDTTLTTALTRSGIPVRALTAYVAAAQTMAAQQPSCRIHWSLLAGIGRVESNHGRFGGAGISADGRVSPAILGPRLDGSHAGWAVIRDSDRGRYDGDALFDRAVGPMQFLPGTWTAYARDADGTGTIDPQDLDDAALAAARYLCAGGGDLSTQTGRWNAVYRYNRSSSYVQLVLGLADSYASGRAQPLPNPEPGPPGPVSEPPATPIQDAPGLQPDPTTPGGTPTPTTPPATKPDPGGVGTPPPQITPTPGPTTPTTPPTTPTPTPTPPGTGTGTGTTTPTPTDTGTTTPTPTDTGTTTPTPTDTGTPAPTDTATTAATTTTTATDPATTTSTPPDPAPATSDPAPAATTPALAATTAPADQAPPPPEPPPEPPPPDPTTATTTTSPTATDPAAAPTDSTAPP